MLTHRKPSACQGCELARQAINGLYCTQLKCYVEHQQMKPCEKEIKTNDSDLKSDKQDSYGKDNACSNEIF